MERYFTDTVYARRSEGIPLELERKEKCLYAELSAHIPGEKYLRIEEQLNHFHDELGKELFGRGFMEGMHTTQRNICSKLFFSLLYAKMAVESIRKCRMRTLQ